MAREGALEIDLKYVDVICPLCDMHFTKGGNFSVNVPSKVFNCPHCGGNVRIMLNDEIMDAPVGPKGGAVNEGMA